MFYPSFNATLAAAGADVKRLAVRSPNTNAYVERFIQAIQQKCLDKFIAFGPEHLDHVVREYLAYYHHERPHQGKGNRPPNDDGRDPPGEGECCAASGWAGCCGTTTGMRRDRCGNARDPGRNPLTNRSLFWTETQVRTG